jgi:hypothetical protein
MADNQVDLRTERERVDDLWQRMVEAYVPVSVAAALTFHQVHGNTRAIVTRQDYDDALGIAAAALSRLVPIYTLDNPAQGRMPVAVDLTQQQFVRGATELRSKDGTRLGNLSLQRGEMLSAISLIRRAGLPFSFALPLAREKDATHEPTPTPVTKRP